MESNEILKFCIEKGVLLDKEVLNLFKEVGDVESAKLILEKIKMTTQKKIITREIFDQNIEQVNQVFFGLPKENQKSLEKLKIKLGLSIEISREKEVLNNSLGNFKKEESSGKVKILSKFFPKSKKLEVSDFVVYFKNRLSEMKNVLQENPRLKNLVSINKISENRQGFSIIGIVSDKRITKNKNLLFEMEDLTGKIRILVNENKKELIEQAREISLDSVVGFNCSGNREICFANDIIFPDSALSERKKSLVEEYALFIGDLHFGSERFLKDNFLKFIDYLNGKVPNTPEVAKIKYLFVVGDLVTGVGNYPNQESDLEVNDLEEQFSLMAGFLGMIRKDIKIIISPGNHDGVRLMEPQPLLDERYAWPLYELENVVVTNNPTTVNIGSADNFSGFNVLTYHGFSFPFYAGTVNSLVKTRAMNQPELIISYLLKNRHLAPTHASVQYFPSEQDAHLIRDVPDIFVAGHTHKSGVLYHNNILIISVSSWEGMTPYQEKFGNEPDHCKVPMFNLKTRAVKILDFE